MTLFHQGATAAEIVNRYPSLNLADVYATIAFYLKHQSEVESYLQQRQQQAQEIRVINQGRFDPQGLRRYGGLLILVFHSKVITA